MLSLDPASLLLHQHAQSAVARDLDQDAGERRRKRRRRKVLWVPMGTIAPFAPLSPVQIRVNSSRMIWVTQVDSEEELGKSSVWSFLSSFLKEKLNDTSIDVDLYSKKTCFKVELLEDGTVYCIVLFRRTAPPWWGGFRGGNEDTGSCAEGRSFLGKENGLQREVCVHPWGVTVGLWSGVACDAAPSLSL